MKEFSLLIGFIITLHITLSYQGDSKSPSSFSNPLKIFNKCISDHECKNDEYCDHTGINPIGSCKQGTKILNFIEI